MIELGSIIQDTSERVIVPTVSIPETGEQTFIVLENVRPDDVWEYAPQASFPPQPSSWKRWKMRPAINSSPRPRKR